MTGRRERNKQEKLARIKAAAATLLDTKGYEQMTTREVAEAADVGTGTLFLYVKDKSELLMLVYGERIQQRLDQRLTSLETDSTLLEQLGRLYGEALDDVADDRNLRIFLAEARRRGTGEYAAQAAAIRSHTLEATVDLIHAAQRHGEVHPNADPAQAAWNFYALWQAALDGLRLDSDLNRARALLQRAFAMQFAGLASRIGLH
ncbi:TetR/AcrR family transcriptional regulator [Streptomyces sp. NPDC046909]|uniref:TetR/AcrR family transcriptional regulator n=1 Tax=Streptomyces sp. NPDC046909 TaxID=3155617 RepID=UPI0033CF165B